MTTKRQIKCAIYTRKSSEEGLEQDFNSLDAQREACEAYAASQRCEGWIALKEYYDDGGFSGGTLDRPALQRLLADIEAGRVDVVVVYKIDRLSRSLMDFAKLVEVFDRKAVTFVSVTQSFNTTTSMGRLTLNVLLSFAQFEREVTGERIRDKFAASRRKGMWMGGRPPLGYDIGNRKLVVNSAEAKTVRLIFQRYLDVGCVRLLRGDLAQRGVVSKSWTSSTNVQHGGAPFDRGALYCLLRNRTYVGEVIHKGAVYPGEHDLIVARDLFDAVQCRLADTRRRQKGKRSSTQEALLSGILFDEAGAPMTPTYSVKPDGRRYRYYASPSTFRAETAKVSLPRIPAIPLETFVEGALRRIGLEDLRHSDTLVVRRVDIRSNTIVLTLDRVAAVGHWRTGLPGGMQAADILARWSAALSEGETLQEDGEVLVLTLPVRARFRGGRSAMIAAPGTASASGGTDAALIRAVARAHSWKEMLMSGKVTSIEALAKQVGQERRHVTRTLALAFLSPNITRAILNGDQPAGLRLTHLLNVEIPLLWSDQSAMIERLRQQ